MCRRILSSAVLLFAMFAGIRSVEALVPTGPSSSFTLTIPTAVPGLVLPAGSFKMVVVDHLPDRYVMRVEDQAGNVLAMFLAVEDPQLATHAGTGMIAWNGSDSSSKRYMRGWTFPQGKPALEFVYPKTDAVAIAQMNHTRVAAIDPASDGLAVRGGARPGLSKEDLQIVTLWLLTPTHVGAGDHRPGVAGARYQPAPEPQQAQMAQGVKPVAPTALPSSAYVQTLQPSQKSRAARLAVRRLAAQQKREAQEARLALQKPVASQPTQTAQLEAPPLPPSGRRTVIAKLPHTAGNVGLVWLVGLMSTLGAGMLRMRRAMRQTRPLSLRRG
jgi:hypothetical protein